MVISYGTKLSGTAALVRHPASTSHGACGDPAKNLATQVMNYVRDCAQNGSMAPGEWYSVYKLSEQLGISRSPFATACCA